MWEECKREKRTAYRVLMVKHEGKRSLGRPNLYGSIILN